ncbi:MAG: hypothetical protein K5771_01685 [Oscillospiraceae bacterium]|nr:hypothetical protein [Oscillospiraceae bacterium]
MAYTSKTLIKQNLKAEMHDYRMAHEQAQEASKAARLAAGKAPISGKITEDNQRRWFINKGTVLKDKALRELDYWRDQVTRAKTTAPSEDALRAIQAFKLRSPKTMTREEYQAEAQELADSVKDNYSAYATIYDIAAENGAHIALHPFAEEIKAFESVEHNIRSYFNPVIDAGGSGPSAGREALNAMILDELMGE